MIEKTKAFLCAVIIATISLPLQAAPSGYDFIPIQEEMQIAQPVIEKNAMVVTQEKLASKAGLEI
jgi:gamma-glutamyltranspeptidase/glutathione hydrolase